MFKSVRDDQTAMDRLLPAELWQLVARHACRVHNGVGIFVYDTQVWLDSYLDDDRIRVVVFEAVDGLPEFSGRRKRSSRRKIYFERPLVVDLRCILDAIAESLPHGLSLCNRCVGRRSASFGILEHSRLFSVSRSLQLVESRDGTECPMPPPRTYRTLVE